jgi:lipopolysaccharide/colanic/teichoic acid biosynthesis glycosyltransferase
MKKSELRDKKSLKIYGIYIKPVFDIVLAFLLSLLLLPIIFIIWFIVYIKFGSPVLYYQSRPGKNGKLFSIYKFRTMTNEKNSEGILLSDSERLTIFGQFLRKTSLDEIPQLFNVIKGDLSFVGPRPLLVEYLPLYNDLQKKRHNLKPGITGWAQVNGRNAITWEDKFRLDIYYIENVSFVLDMRILFKTFLRVIKRSDINNVHGETMEKFKGNK